MKNIAYKPGYQMAVVVTDPAVPASGDPMRFGFLTGIAVNNEGAGGVLTTQTVCDFGPFVANFSVIDEVGGGIVASDTIFYDDALHGLTNDPSGNYFFGFALAIVGIGATTTIAVAHLPSPGFGDSPALHRIDMVGGATATVNTLLTHKERVIDAWVVLKAAGTAGDTVQVKNVAAAITDAMDINDVDTTISRAGTINDANQDVLAGTNLAITETDGGGTDSPACTVYVLATRVA